MTDLDENVLENAIPLGAALPFIWGKRLWSSGEPAAASALSPLELGRHTCTEKHAALDHEK